MPEFSKRSEKALATCDDNLRAVFETVIVKYDCTILTGRRGKKKQNEAYRTGRSTKQWPDSMHNQVPSQAVDVAPYPIDWDDRERFYHFAGYVMATAEAMGVDLRWGGDWNSNNIFKDNDFDDLAHFEAVNAAPARDFDYMHDER